MLADLGLQRIGKNSRAVLETLAAPDHDLVQGAVDVLYPEPQTFLESQTGAEKKPADKQRDALHLPEYGKALLLRAYHGKTVRLVGPERIDFVKIDFQHVPV
jgi:hypothetical protein